MKVALFGGSFNPVHNTHLKMATTLINEGLVDEVWFIPCGNHPFDKEIIFGEDRLNMLKLAISDNNKFKIVDYEIKRKEKSYTSETLKFLKEKYVGIDFYFILGTDNLGNIDTWHNFDYIRNNLKFILFIRKGFSLDNKFGLNIVKTFESDGVSSTEIRNNLKSGKNYDNFVNRKVKKYIVSGGFYDKEI